MTSIAAEKHVEKFSFKPTDTQYVNVHLAARKENCITCFFYSTQSKSYQLYTENLFLKKFGSYTVRCKRVKIFSGLF